MLILVLGRAVAGRGSGTASGSPSIMCWGIPCLSKKLRVHIRFIRWRSIAWQHITPDSSAIIATIQGIGELIGNSVPLIAGCPVLAG